MAVKIGNSYVSEAAAAYAQSKIDTKSENVLSDLSNQFKDVKFGVGTQPFSGTGTNNISIAPNILRQMANDPEKRLEYEALIYDFSNVLNDSSNRPPGLKSQGFIIGSNGELSMWMSSQSGNEKPTRSILHFNDEKQRTKAKTDKVDAEIKSLKAKKAQLEQKIASEANHNADLQRQLAQVENELRQKDNDTYRKAHTDFSNVIDIKV